MKNVEGYRYFLVEEGSEALRVIQCWQEQMAEHREHLNSLKERHGVSSIWERNSAFSGTEITGVSFPEGKIPQGWRHLKRNPDGMLIPVNGKQGGAARQLIKAMGVPSRNSVHKAIGYKDGFTISGDMSVRSAGFNSYAGKMIAHVPKDCKGYEPPAGLKEIKMSELYALIEQSEEGVLP